jgi:hypothetical protein
MDVVVWPEGMDHPPAFAAQSADGGLGLASAEANAIRGSCAEARASTPASAPRQYAVRCASAPASAASA